MLDRVAVPTDLPPKREPISDVPRAIVLTIAILAAVHLARTVVPDIWDEWMLLHGAFVPGRVTLAFDPQRVVDALVRLSVGDDASIRQAQVGRFFLGDGTMQPWTVLTYGLLHANWAHLGLNALWFLAFGTPVARRLGARRFFVFLGVAAVAGAAVHYATHATDLQPVIGASAAVSGCMGGALRFMFQPRTAVSSLIAWAGGDPSPMSGQPLVPLRRLVRDRRAVAFFAVWFATNLVFGLGSVMAGDGGGGIAWQAHIGGFFAGLLLLPRFERTGFGLAVPGRGSV